MSDMWIDLNTAVAIAVNKVPLVLKADGVTINAAVAFDAPGMDLNWNFITSAGVQTQVNVVPTSAGLHDWTAPGNGMFKIAIPDTGGTINNNVAGYGWFSGETTAEAPWAGPVFGFRSADLNDALCDGGTLLADIAAMRGGIILGTAVTGTLAANQCTTDLTGFTVSQLIGRGLTWLGGPAEGEQTKITGFAVSGSLLSFSVLTVVPEDGDPFKIT